MVNLFSFGVISGCLICRILNPLLVWLSTPRFLRWLTWLILFLNNGEATSYLIFLIPLSEASHLSIGISKENAFDHLVWYFNNAFATRENLHSRKCKASLLCVIYCLEVETIEHLLFRCKWTRSVWSSSVLSELVH